MCYLLGVPKYRRCLSQTFFFLVSDSLFSSTGYTFGAPTPPPGSPYSPVQVTQLELLAKGFTNSNIIIQQPDYPPSPKKPQLQENNKRCDEKCCNLKPQKPCGCQQVREKTIKHGIFNLKKIFLVHFIKNSKGFFHFFVLSNQGILFDVF